jgi:hypothetical protein
MRYLPIGAGGVVLIALALSVSAAGASAQQKHDAALDGRWSGLVNADAGQMPIDVTLKVVDGKASGTIATGHGELAISGGTFADGKWTLPFSGHGMSGRLVATLQGDTLSGDWINPGVAVGTFSLTRAK